MFALIDVSYDNLQRFVCTLSASGCAQFDYYTAQVSSLCKAAGAIIADGSLVHQCISTSLFINASKQRAVHIAYDLYQPGILVYQR